MPQATTAGSHSVSHPLDTVEEIISANEWPCDRTSDDELIAEIPGKWGDYRIHFAWTADMSTLHFSCTIDLKVPRQSRAPVAELLALANERLWLGHFGLSADDGQPMFRYAVPLRGEIGRAHV